MTLSAPSIRGQVRFSTLYTGAGWRPVGLTSANSVLYGASQLRGSNETGCGTVFELQYAAGGPGATWTQTALYSFTGPNGDLCDPVFAPVVSANGGLYGLTYEGGALGFGGLYQLQESAPGAAWTESVLYSFAANGTASGYALSNLIPGPDGSFYLLTSDGDFGRGRCSSYCHRQQPAELGPVPCFTACPCPRLGRDRLTA